MLGAGIIARKRLAPEKLDPPLPLPAAAPCLSFPAAGRGSPQTPPHTRCRPRALHRAPLEMHQRRRPRSAGGATAPVPPKIPPGGHGAVPVSGEDRGLRPGVGADGGGTCRQPPRAHRRISPTRELANSPEIPPHTPPTPPPQLGTHVRGHPQPPTSTPPPPFRTRTSARSHACPRIPAASGATGTVPPPRPPPPSPRDPRGTPPQPSPWSRRSSPGPDGGTNAHHLLGGGGDALAGANREPCGRAALPARRRVLVSPGCWSSKERGPYLAVPGGLRGAGGGGPGGGCSVGCPAKGSEGSGSALPAAALLPPAAAPAAARILPAGSEIANTLRREGEKKKKKRREMGKKKNKK